MQRGNRGSTNGDHIKHGPVGIELHRQLEEEFLLGSKRGGLHLHIRLSQGVINIQPCSSTRKIKALLKFYRWGRSGNYGSEVKSLADRVIYRWQGDTY